MVDMSVTVGTLRLKNPVMPASGTFDDGLGKVMDLNRLGAIVTKTVTPEIREGCVPPRIVEYRDATLMACGLPNKGPEHYVKEIVRFYRRFATPLVASVSAPSIEEFARLTAAISVSGVAAIEANISCPNTEKDGLAFSMDCESTEKVIRAMKGVTDRPVWAKLTPNVTSIADVARAAESGGADAVTVANGMLGMEVDIENCRPALGNVMGGLTGPAIKPVLLRMAYQVARAVRIPVIGCGGIATAKDAIAYMMVGASAVQVGTATFIHPTVMLDIIAGIEEFCRRKGLDRASELTGALVTQ
jgi:dihydroorotate dehydrogenase (NAD+) catalytic subunit